MKNMGLCLNIIFNAFQKKNFQRKYHHGASAKKSLSISEQQDESPVTSLHTFINSFFLSFFLPFFCGPPILGSHLFWSPSMICITDISQQCFIYWTCVNCKQYGNLLSSPSRKKVEKISTPAWIWTRVSLTTI